MIPYFFGKLDYFKDGKVMKTDIIINLCNKKAIIYSIKPI